MEQKRFSDWLWYSVQIFSFALVAGMVLGRLIHHEIFWFLREMQVHSWLKPQNFATFSRAEEWLQLFVNNLVACLLLILGGVIVGRTICVILLSINGALVGYVVSAAIIEVAGLNLTKALTLSLPHGIVEIPCYWVSAALGMQFGWGVAFKPTKNPQREQQFKRIVFGFPVVALGVAVAAYLEAYVTPALYQYLFHAVVR